MWTKRILLVPNLAVACTEPLGFKGLSMVDVLMVWGSVVHSSTYVVYISAWAPVIIER
jgi:hypothetical protein